jgi:hypothetical protein
MVSSFSFTLTSEHEPMHIHVSKGDEYAKVELATLKMTRNTFKSKDLKQVLHITQIHKQAFTEAWNEYFGKR